MAERPTPVVAPSSATVTISTTALRQLLAVWERDQPGGSEVPFDAQLLDATATVLTGVVEAAELRHLEAELEFAELAAGNTSPGDHVCPAMVAARVLERFATPADLGTLELDVVVTEALETWPGLPLDAETVDRIGEVVDGALAILGAWIAAHDRQAQPAAGPAVVVTLGDTPYVVDVADLAASLGTVGSPSDLSSAGIARARQLEADAGGRRAPADFTALRMIPLAVVGLAGACGRYYEPTPLGPDHVRQFCRGCLEAGAPELARDTVVAERIEDPTGRRSFHYCADHVPAIAAELATEVAR